MKNDIYLKQHYFFKTPDESHPVLIISYMEDRLYGWELEVQGSPVVWARIQALLQDVGLAAKSRLFKAHPPARDTETTSWDVMRVINRNSFIRDRKSCQLIITAQPKNLGLIKSLYRTVCRYEKRSTLLKGCKTI